MAGLRAISTDEAITKLERRTTQLGEVLRIHRCTTIGAVANANGETNFRVRNCRIIHLKSLDHLGLLIVFFCATVSVAAIRHGGWDEQQAS
jgi:hypothetical protein